VNNLLVDVNVVAVGITSDDGDDDNDDDDDDAIGGSSR